MKSKICIFLFLFISIFIYLNREEYRQQVFAADPSGYYAYLPALFIYHDLQKMDFYSSITKEYNLNGGDAAYGIYPLPNGNKIIKYAIGTAVFEFPFFLCARAYCHFDKRHPDDGYSMPFEIMAAMSCTVFVVLALFLLRGFLADHFSDAVVAMTLCCIAFGTTLYYYTAWDPCSSHPYSFFAVSGILYSTGKWYKTRKGKFVLCLGLFLGLTVITRPINVMVVIIPLLWMVDSAVAFRQRLSFFYAQRGNILFSLLLFVLVLFIQLSYWHSTTGHWVYYSYTSEGFNFLQPMILQGLFSFKQGWFVYTPMAILATLGFIDLYKKDRRLFSGPLLFFILYLYIVFSWHMWWYGGGFACRVLIDALPVAALPLAAFMQQLLSTRNKAWKTVKLSLVIFFIALNLFQTYQFSLNVIYTEGMTFESYLKTFGKIKS